MSRSTQHFPNGLGQIRLSAVLLSAMVLSTGAVAGEACGVISTFFDGPETKNIYEARVGVVDGKNQLLEKREHKVAAGSHEIKVYEQIDAPELRVDGRHRGYGRVLKIEVEANKVYRIGAQFRSEKRFDRNEFWEPVVWQVADKECAL